ncbi:MAG: sel1 repeat family protein [Magnetococcales bacterium]|nr:sel1 repeat family protein [Magnetococcales bacterium]
MAMGFRLWILVWLGLLGGIPVIGDAAPLDSWIRQAEQGDVKAQLKLGQMFHEGRGVAVEYRQAMRWYRLAAAQGNAEAQNGVGTLYDNGKGVTRDYREAARWFLMAAEQDHVLARRNLGWMYEKGQGLVQDDERSYLWQFLAQRARDGKRVGQENDPCRFCATVAARMTPARIARAREMARQWKPGEPLVFAPLRPRQGSGATPR